MITSTWNGNKRNSSQVPRWIWCSGFVGLTIVNDRKLINSVILQYYNTPKGNDMDLEKDSANKNCNND